MDKKMGKKATWCGLKRDLKTVMKYENCQAAAHTRKVLLVLLADPQLLRN